MIITTIMSLIMSLGFICPGTSTVDRFQPIQQNTSKFFYEETITDDENNPDKNNNGIPDELEEIICVSYGISGDQYFLDKNNTIEKKDGTIIYNIPLKFVDDTRRTVGISIGQFYYDKENGLWIGNITDKHNDNISTSFVAVNTEKGWNWNMDGLDIDGNRVTEYGYENKKTNKVGKFVSWYDPAKTNPFVCDVKSYAVSEYQDGKLVSYYAGAETYNGGTYRLVTDQYGNKIWQKCNNLPIATYTGISSIILSEDAFNRQNFTNVSDDYSQFLIKDVDYSGGRIGVPTLSDNEYFSNYMASLLLEEKVVIRGEDGKLHETNKVILPTKAQLKEIARKTSEVYPYYEYFIEPIDNIVDTVGNENKYEDLAFNYYKKLAREALQDRLLYEIERRRQELLLRKEMTRAMHRLQSITGNYVLEYPQ